MLIYFRKKSVVELWPSDLDLFVHFEKVPEAKFVIKYCHSFYNAISFSIPNILQTL